jgi:peptidyl-tRNA hydrolase, PTH1 family
MANPSPKLIVGLGNPGGEYNGTRHNVGFVTIDVLAKRLHIQVKSRRGKAIIGEGEIAGQPVILAKPYTFMNLSGQAVADLARRYRLSPADIIVVCDDVNLPLGKLRIRASGSAGGHNGLKSIIQSLNSNEFPRVRIGIGSPRGEMIDHVLSKFHRNEQPAIEDGVLRAADAVEISLAEGIDRAMNSFNADKSIQGGLDK